MKVGVIGASGYTGGELLRLLAEHPEVEVVAATSREYAGRPVHHVHFNLRGHYKGLRFEKLDVDRLAERLDAAFLALPHGVSLHLVPRLMETGVLVVDLSADYRLKDPKAYEKWYGSEHPYPDLLARSVYGLPEFHRDELRRARLVAVPGCNATAAIFASAPLAASGLLQEPRILVDVKAGSSEHGAKPGKGTHHPEREGAVRPYSPGGHRHQAEVEQELARLSGKEFKVSLVPHAVSTVRGVLASAHAWIRGDAGFQKLWAGFVAMYRGERFVRLIHPTTPPGAPDPKYVAGSNYVDVGLAVDQDVGRATGFAAIDNLVRGAAGQALQSFNLAAGFPEDTGLRQPPLHPV